MTLERFVIVKLNPGPSGDFVLLSYPGIEVNGTVVIAPLLKEGDIAIVDSLHPIVETPSGQRVVAVERLAAVAPERLSPTADTLLAYDYVFQRAISRLFFGN